MSVSFTFSDRGAKKLAKTFRELGSYDLMIGVQGPSGAKIYPNRKQEINVASVAYYQEFGTKAINSRSFLRRTMFQRRRAIEKTLQRAATKAVDTGKVLDALSEAGEDIVEMVRTTILSSRSWAKPNAPSTIAKKGFDWPLIETGLLAEESISYSIRTKTGQIVRSGDSFSG